MKGHKKLLNYNLVLVGILFVLVFTNCKRENKKSTSTWATYKADEKSTSYSPLDQINISNVNQLQNAWTFQTNDLSQGEG